jgi:hypothetical protein
MQNKVYLDDGIIVIEVIGDQDEESVEHMGQEIDALITGQRKLGRPALLLDNLLKIGAVDSDTRKLVVQLAKRLDYDRAAMLGKGGIMRFGTNLMLRATRQSYKLRYFESADDAKSWLRQAVATQ